MGGLGLPGVGPEDLTLHASTEPPPQKELTSPLPGHCKTTWSPAPAFYLQTCKWVTLLCQPCIPIQAALRERVMKLE